MLSDRTASTVVICEAAMHTNPGLGGCQRVTQPFDLTGDASKERSVRETQRARAAFIESIARDVRRPLATIMSAANTLQRRGAAAHESVRAELIGVVEIEAERLEGFVSILVDMAKLQAGAIDDRAEPLELAEVVAAALDDAASGMKDRKVEVNLSADLPKLRLCRAILRRVLAILIGNAAARTPVNSTVSVQAGRDTTGVRLQVLDQGSGVPPAEVDKLFSQFHLPCIDEEFSWRSAGMQLAVCRGYVEAMGGTIAAGNRTDGNGAVFTITFPCQPGAESFGLM